MILALDDDVPDVGLGGHPRPGGGPRPVDDPAGGRPLTADQRPPRSPTASTRRSSSSATASPTFIVEGRFQGQAETPLSPIGARQAALVADRLAATARRPGPAGPGRRPARARPLAARADDRDRRRRSRRRCARPGVAWRAGRTRGLPRDRPGRLGGPAPRRDRASATAGARGLAADARSRPGRPAASRSPRSQARVRPALAIAARTGSPRAAPPGTARSPAGRRLRGPAARPPVVDRRRPRRRLQGRAADPVRPAARAVLDVVDGPVRDHDRRAPRRPPGPPRPQPDRPPGATREDEPSRRRDARPTARSSPQRGGARDPQRRRRRRPLRRRNGEAQEADPQPALRRAQSRRAASVAEDLPGRTTISTLARATVSSSGRGRRQDLAERSRVLVDGLGRAAARTRAARRAG